MSEDLVLSVRYLSTIFACVFQIVSVDQCIDHEVDGGLRNLQEIFRRYGLNATMEKLLDDLVEEGMYLASAVKGELDTINMQQDLGRANTLMQRTETIGFYR